MKAAEMELLILQDKMCEILLENRRLKQQMGNAAYYANQLTATLIECKKWKERALTAESKLRKIHREVVGR